MVTRAQGDASAIGFEGVHHVGFITADLGRSLEFYEGILGLDTNPDRPNDKLPYGGGTCPTTICTNWLPQVPKFPVENAENILK